MQAHRDERTPDLEIVEVSVHATRIVDLRSESALSACGVDISDAMAPWQRAVADGDTPSSWRVRDQLTAHGAYGLIDPSRTTPGLWHLVLFQWNTGQTPTVALRRPTAPIPPEE